jgi:hypothetical protein
MTRSSTGAQDNPVDLVPKLVSAERALAAIRAGSRIYIGTGCAAPPHSACPVDVRGLAGSGQLDYVPISLEEIPRLLTSGRLSIDVALLQVSPPDARGSSASVCPWISRPRSERRADRNCGDQSSDAAHAWRASSISTGLMRW